MIIVDYDLIFSKLTKLSFDLSLTYFSSKFLVVF
ncbi:MAG: hypothetical protein RL344_1154 [Pseudomonadota bacterium]|jgi:hypothetical protein